jgi:anthranilate/para-aminobenzoate synthase component I
VADSNPEAEYEETLAKAQGLFATLGSEAGVQASACLTEQARA